jgi:glycosyltransferase involved in cell wall biosynthesis
MSRQKGGRWVVELAKRFKGQNVKFILIGVKDLNEKFDDNIIALGRTSNQVELAEYYSMADVFVICSERENFPTTCLEALACGTPVVGFDVGGTNETIPHESFGKFVLYSDISQLEYGVQTFLEKERSLAVKSSISGFPVNQFSKIRMSKAYKGLYSGKD